MAANSGFFEIVADLVFGQRLSEKKTIAFDESIAVAFRLSIVVTKCGQKKTPTTQGKFAFSLVRLKDEVLGSARLNVLKLPILWARQIQSLFVFQYPTTI